MFGQGSWYLLELNCEASNCPRMQLRQLIDAFCIKMTDKDCIPNLMISFLLMEVQNNLGNRS